MSDCDIVSVVRNCLRVNCRRVTGYGARAHRLSRNRHLRGAAHGRRSFGVVARQLRIVVATCCPTPPRTSFAESRSSALARTLLRRLSITDIPLSRSWAATRRQFDGTDHGCGPRDAASPRPGVAIRCPGCC